MDRMRKYQQQNGVIMNISLFIIKYIFVEKLKEQIKRIQKFV